jgi:hypothetical protein
MLSVLAVLLMLRVLSAHHAFGVIVLLVLTIFLGTSPEIQSLPKLQTLINLNPNF